MILRWLKWLIRLFKCKKKKKMLKFLVVGTCLEILDGTTRVGLHLTQLIGLNVGKLYESTPVIELYNINEGVDGIIFTRPLSQVVDESDVTFTVDSLIAYVEANFGLNK